MSQDVAAPLPYYEQLLTALQSIPSDARAVIVDHLDDAALFGLNGKEIPDEPSMTVSIAEAIWNLVERVIAEDLPRIEVEDVGVAFGYAGGQDAATVELDGLGQVIVLSDDLRAVDQLAALCARVGADYVVGSLPAPGTLAEAFTGSATDWNRLTQPSDAEDEEG